MFENKEVKVTGEKYSRYIASWVVAHRQRKIFGDPFRTWLESMGLTEDEVRECYNLATNGKLEFESCAKLFLNEWRDSLEDYAQTNGLEKMKNWEYPWGTS